MKRNKHSTRTMRHRRTAESTGNASRYALKKARGKQLYGPGCCAHSLPDRF
jgi:hypothetical protein